MSYVIPAYSYDDEAGHAHVDSMVDRELIFVPRSRYQWVAFLPSIILCGISWMANGVPALTDAGFLIFAIVCGIYLCVEFYRFPVRFGIGGLCLWGGTLCWFGQDYFTNWFRHDFINSTNGIQPWVVAKTATLLSLLVMMMSIGLGIQRGRWIPRLLTCIPTPADNRAYLMLVLVMFAIGISPYFIFNAEPFYMALFHAAFAGWTGSAKLTVFRDGNLNYSWGAYVAQIIQVGEVGGIFAILYCLMIARSAAGRIVGAAIWLFWAISAFSTDRRGEISFFLLPPIALLFIKYQARSAALFKKLSVRSYAVCGFLTFGLFVIVQFQGTFRGAGFNNADISKLDITKNQGNTMFSEGLKGFEVIPNQRPYFHDEFPGAQWVWPIPQAAFDLVVGIIPRALWNNKPVDAMWEWYNKLVTGDRNGTVGTTISHGLVGFWYFQYGWAGVIEGGLLVGWLMSCAERGLQTSGGQPIGILMSLGFTVWLFRIFRDFIYIDLYGLIIGAVVLAVLVWATRPILGGPPSAA